MLEAAKKAGINNVSANSTSSGSSSSTTTSSGNTSPEKPKNGSTGYVTGTNVNLRVGPSTAFQSIGKTQTGDTFVYNNQVEMNGYLWFNVIMTSGSCKQKAGWLVSDWAAFDKKKT